MSPGARKQSCEEVARSITFADFLQQIEDERSAPRGAERYGIAALRAPWCGALRHSICSAGSHVMFKMTSEPAEEHISSAGACSGGGAYLQGKGKFLDCWAAIFVFFYHCPPGKGKFPDCWAAPSPGGQCGAPHPWGRRTCSVPSPGGQKRGPF